MEIQKKIKGEKNMKTEELYKIVKMGKNPIVEIQSNIEDFANESFDPMMMGKVVEVTQEFNDTYRFVIDMNEFEEYNKTVARNDWTKDGNKVTWFETSFYPKDGKEVLYLPIGKDIEMPIKIVSDHSLLTEYVESKSAKNYIEWLEDQVSELRSIIQAFQASKYHKNL